MSARPLPHPRPISPHFPADNSVRSTYWRHIIEAFHQHISWPAATHWNLHDRKLRVRKARRSRRPAEAGERKPVRRMQAEIRRRVRHGATTVVVSCNETGRGGTEGTAGHRRDKNAAPICWFLSTEAWKRGINRPLHLQICPFSKGNSNHKPECKAKIFWNVPSDEFVLILRERDRRETGLCGILPLKTKRYAGAKQNGNEHQAKN